MFDDGGRGSGGGGPVHGKFCHHPCVPYALAWGQAVCCAGGDGRVTFYDPDTAMTVRIIEGGGGILFSRAEEGCLG
jgi:hypothetical protein